MAKHPLDFCWGNSDLFLNKLKCKCEVYYYFLLYKYEYNLTV